MSTPAASVPEHEKVSTPATPAETKPSSEVTAAKPEVAAKPEAAEAKKPAAAATVASLEQPKTKASSASARATSAVFGGWQVQLGAYRTSKNADRGWAKLVEKAGDVLHGLYKLERGDTARAGAGRIKYRLRTPAVQEEARAAAVCKTLQERKIDCLVVHQLIGVWVASAKTVPTRIASAGKPSGEAAQSSAAISAATPAETAGAVAGLVQPIAPSAGTPTSSSWRVQLAAYRTLATTERGRKVLAAKAGDLLPDLKALKRVGKAMGNAINFRLRTAELPDKATATDMCKKLQAKGLNCLVIRQPPDRWTEANAG